MKRALITGITGQDGSYLSEFLLNKGYEVHGIVRRCSLFNTDRLEHLFQDTHDDSRTFILHYGDLADGTSLRRIIDTANPDEVYNLAAQSHVRVSFDQSEYTADVVATGTLRLLEALRDHMSLTGREVRIYQASSSEMFGSALPPQSELTRFHPRSPYAVAKLAAHYFGVNYRESYGMFISNGILFNHESPRRGETFVSRKITRAVGRIKMGLQDKLFMGNTGAKRDWGYAGDYVEAMWLMLQHHTPDDFVIATGESHTVTDMLDEAFGYAGMDWHDYVDIDPRYYRPAEVDHLLGDASKAREALGWAPRTGFRELVRMMVDHDMQTASRESILKHAGYESNLRAA